MPHGVILTKLELLAKAATRLAEEAARAHTYQHLQMVANPTALNAKVDETSDFITDMANDLEGKADDIAALLPSEE